MMPQQGSELPVCLHVSMTLGWFSFLPYELMFMEIAFVQNDKTFYEMRILVINTSHILYIYLTVLF